MLKAKAEVLSATDKRLGATIERCVALETHGEKGEPADWPLRVALGRPSADELAQNMAAVSDYVARLRTWESDAGFEVTWTQRQAGGLQVIPTHVVVRDVDVAAHMLGRDAERRLAMLRERAGRIRESSPGLDASEMEHVLRATKAWDDVDFALLLDAGRWFADHDARGLTPRQVPLAGFHAKWLNARQRRSLVAMLAGKEGLGLLEPPASVAFSYLDERHLEGGGRRFDLYVLGDTWFLPYHPDVAVIVENKDSYRYFPTFSRGVCIFGAGWSGASHVRELPWLRDVAHVFYWGDMDADGLEILNGYREGGLEVSSILMDLPSYRRYERFGTSAVTGKRALETRVRKDLPCLTADERKLYDLLCDPAHKGHRRVEQERIPLEDARAALSEALRPH